MTALVFDPLKDARHKTARAARDCADWRAHKELEGLSPRSLDDYEWTVAKLLRLFPEKAIGEFTDGDLSHFLHTFPPGSRRVRRAAAMSFFGWAYMTRRIKENPLDFVAKPKRPGRKIPNLPTDRDVADLVALPHPDGPLMAILAGTGIRKGEARRLQARHIDLERGILTVYGGKGDKDREVKIGRLVTLLADWFLVDAIGPDDYLWYSKPGGGGLNRTRPIGEGSFHRWYSRCLERAGVDYRNPHTLRHYYGTNWIRKGGRLETLKEQMGHTSIKTTEDLYVHLDLTDVAADLELVEA